MRILKTILFFVLALIANQQKIIGQVAPDPVQPFIEVQDSVIVITDVMLIDGTGGSIKKNQDIIIIGKRIKWVVATGTIAMPKNARILNGKGKTVIPGLVMLHEHLFHVKLVDNNRKAILMPYTFPKMYLAGGVTTLRTAAALEANAELNIRNEILQGKMLGPKMDITTPPITRESLGVQLQSLHGNETPEKMISYWLDKGVTSVKVYENVTKDDLRRAIKIAHARNIKVTGHLCSITYREAAELGIDCIEHGFMKASDFNPDKKENQCDGVKASQTLRALKDSSIELKELMEYLIQKNVTVTYTPNVFEPYTNREVVPGGGIEAMAPFLREQIQAVYNARINKDSAAITDFTKEMARIRQFYKMGGKLIVGTDPTGVGRVIAGYSNQHLIELIIETGFTLEEAIKIATLNGAIYLGRGNEIGSVEAGKIADLIIMNGDLQKDISNIRNMEIVFKDGIGYNSKKIFESVKGKMGLD